MRGGKFSDDCVELLLFVVPLVDDVGSKEEVLPDNKELLAAPERVERVGNIELPELLSDRVLDSNDGFESPCVNNDDILGVNDVPPPPIVVVLGKSDAVVLLLGVEVVCDVDVAVELLAATSDEDALDDICAEAATANEIGDVREDELSADEDVGSIGSILYILLERVIACSS